jgi:Glyoxalase-like domain
MTIELDHLFICSQVNAPEIEQLLDLGLVEGRSNSHPGQGTANRCIFFENFMLELLFAINEEEISNPIIKPTQLRERCNYHQTGYSPFGIAFRRTEVDSELLFETWAYKPPYLPNNLQIDVASHTASHEPFLFVIPFKKVQAQPINHPLGIHKVSKVKITIPSSQSFSEAIAHIHDAQGAVEFLSGTDDLVEIEFDDANESQQQDFRPLLPLTICW